MMDRKTDRRGFIKKIIGGLLVAEATYLLYGVFKPVEKNDVNEEWFDAGDISKFEKGKQYSFTKGNFYISRYDDGGLLALSIKCTHLGCMVNFLQDKSDYECPCHASKFNKYGEVLSPPATRPLDIYPVKVKGGHLLVDIKNPVRRSKFEKSQLTYI